VHSLSLRMILKRVLVGTEFTHYLLATISNYKQGQDLSLFKLRDMMPPKFRGNISNTHNDQLSSYFGDNMSKYHSAMTRDSNIEFVSIKGTHNSSDSEPEMEDFISNKLMILMEKCLGKKPEPEDFDPKAIVEYFPEGGNETLNEIVRLLRKYGFVYGYKSGGYCPYWLAMHGYTSENLLETVKKIDLEFQCIFIINSIMATEDK